MSLRPRLLAGEVMLSGMLSELRNPSAMSLFRTAGLDSLIIDMEHGTYDWADVAAMISVGKGCGLEMVVRVPEVRREPIQKVLDAGADGILVPMVDEAVQAAEVVRMARYPPDGERGAALRRAHAAYRVVPDTAAYLREANDAVGVMVQVETALSVRNAAAISAVPGVDALFVGPWDLSISRGVPGDVWSADARAVYAAVRETAQRHGIAAAIHVTDADQAGELLDEGFTYVSLTSDVSALADSISASTAAARLHIR